MVKQLKKRADHDDNVGAAVALATRVPTSIDKRKRHEAAQETLRGAAARKEVRRRSLGDAPSTSRTGKGFNKENDAPERSGSIFDSLSGLLPFASEATLPLVHLFEAVVKSTHDPPCVGSKETPVQQHPATATPGQVKSKKPVGIMRLPSTPSCTECALSYADDEESLTSGFSKSARRLSLRRLFITSNM
jgi:type II secretory pathway pseudopilin PulG